MSSDSFKWALTEDIYLPIHYLSSRTVSNGGGKLEGDYGSTLEGDSGSKPEGVTGSNLEVTLTIN